MRPRFYILSVISIISYGIFRRMLELNHRSNNKLLLLDRNSLVSPNLDYVLDENIEFSFYRLIWSILTRMCIFDSAHYKQLHH